MPIVPEPDTLLEEFDIVIEPQKLIVDKPSEIKAWVTYTTACEKASITVCNPPCG